MTQPPGEPMNREMRRMSSKMGYDPETQRAQTKQAANKRKKSGPPGEKRVSIIVKSITFFKEAWRELKKVSWPGRKEVLNSTIIVLVCIILVTLLVLGADYGSEKLTSLIYG